DRNPADPKRDSSRPDQAARRVRRRAKGDDAMTDPLIGQVASAARLERFEGAPLALTGRGKRTAVFCFSTWALGRGQLPLWQELSARLAPDAEVIGVAAEVEGERWLRGYLREAK